MPPVNATVYSASIWSKYLALVCSAGLLAIWTLPGTIALRHIFLGLGFISSLFVIREHFSCLKQKTAWPLWMLLSLYLWLLIHLAFFSHEFTAQLAELRSVWARCLLSSVLGLALGLLLSSSKSNSSKLSSEQSSTNAWPAWPAWSPWSSWSPWSRWSRWSLLLLFFGFSAPCWITFASYLYAMSQSGLGAQFDIYNFLYGLYRNKPAYVVFEALTLPLCFILLLKAIQQKLPRWWIALTLLTIILTPFGGFFIGSKIAMALFGISLVIFVIIALLISAKSIVNARQLSLGIIGALVLIGFVGIYGLSKHLERTNSWLAMTDNIRVGIDIDHQDFWKNREAFPRPVNKKGGLVDVSTYERTAWFTAGSRLLMENPQGYGLVHHSFGSLALARWPDFYQPNGKLKGATHSGWLDLALGIGIPGVALILLSLIASWVRSCKKSGLWFSYAVWAIPLLIFTYFITEVGEGHFLELLLFMTAFFCALTVPRQTKNIAHV